jgi:hypothetical protein
VYQSLLRRCHSPNGNGETAVSSGYCNTSAIQCDIESVRMGVGSKIEIVRRTLNASMKCREQTLIETKFFFLPFEPAAPGPNVVSFMAPVLFHNPDFIKIHGEGWQPVDHTIYQVDGKTFISIMANRSVDFDSEMIPDDFDPHL